MRILIATDTWHPDVNGVVRTLTNLAAVAKGMGVAVEFLTPQSFRPFDMPGYAGLKLAIPSPSRIARLIEDARPDAIHIATEGPIGIMVRRYCRRHGLAFTTSFHTRFPDYVSARLPIPESWVWAFLRWFHSESRTVMAATPALTQELRDRGFGRVALWSRGVDAELFDPAKRVDMQWQQPVFLCVGRVAVEKNIEAFLGLDLPGSKVVVGDGPAREELQRRFPEAIFLGAKFGEELARIYASADVFVFPSRTDTFGLVMLEALASGVPVAAFPVCGPRDVIGDASVGVLREDLREACLAALNVSRADCRAFALERGWDASVRAFIDNVTTVCRAQASAAQSPILPDRMPYAN